LAKERFEAYGPISKKRLFSDLHFYHFFHATLIAQQNIFLLNVYCDVLYGIRFSSIKDLFVKISQTAMFSAMAARKTASLRSPRSRASRRDRNSMKRDGRDKARP
jgi:hypothetical protein